MTQIGLPKACLKRQRNLPYLVLTHHHSDHGGVLDNTPRKGQLSSIAQDSTISFAEKVQQLGLEVEKIYGVHGRAATPAELRTAIEKRRASELK